MQRGYFDMNDLCVIPARGGSKRIPRKNIREFCGKPIIAYSIIAALESGLFEEVMVSTDDTEIATVAQSYGASVPFMRSEKASDDYSTTADVMFEVLDSYEKKGIRIQRLCCLYPTAPFVTADELQRAMKLFDQGASSVIPVCSYDFPPLRGFRIDEEGSLVYAFPEYATCRSQDLPELMHDCGRFYIAWVNKYVESGSFLTDNTMPLRISAGAVQDIDTLEDWAVAEQKYEALNRRGSL